MYACKNVLSDICSACKHSQRGVNCKHCDVNSKKKGFLTHELDAQVICCFRQQEGKREKIIQTLKNAQYNLFFFLSKHRC